MERNIVALHGLAAATLHLLGPVRIEGHPPPPDPIVEVQLEDFVGKRIDAGQVLGVKPRLLILGSPGAGKTTLLRSHALSLAKSFLEAEARGIRSKQAPLYISAGDIRHYVDEARTFVPLLSRICAERYAFRIDSGSLEQMLLSGSIELLIDGLDELGLDWNSTVGNLSDFLRQNVGVRAVVSSRPAALTVNFSQFAVYSICYLNQAQLRQIIERLTPDEKLARQFADAVDSSAVLSELARSPLLLQLLFDSFVRQGALPTNRSLMYADYIDAAFARRNRRTPIRLSKAIQLEVISAAAETLFRGSVNSLSQTDLEEIARRIIPDRAPTEIISEITYTGIFIERGPNLYGFVHKSFEEYFVAWRHRDDIDALITLLNINGTEAILEFASGMLDNVAPLVEAAVSQGKLIQAAIFVSAGRHNNRMLEAYVAQAFRQVLGNRFLGILARQPDPANGTRSSGPSEQPDPEEKGRKADVAAHSVPDRASVSPDRIDRPLLDLFDALSDPRVTNDDKGRRFEEFTAGLFNEVFSVAMRNRLTERGEIDLIVELSQAGNYWAKYGNEAIVECKNLNRKVNVEQVGTFAAKAAQARVSLAFMVSMKGFTRDAIRMLLANASNPANPVIVAIVGEDIRKALQTSEVLEEFFKSAVRAVIYPPRSSYVR